MNSSLVFVGIDCRSYIICIWLMFFFLILSFFLSFSLFTVDPSLELVVGLELDQFVLRNSFRYFHTQPHFDDKRVYVYIIIWLFVCLCVVLLSFVCHVRSPRIISPHLTSPHLYWTMFSSLSYEKKKWVVVRWRCKIITDVTQIIFWFLWFSRCWFKWNCYVISSYW